MPKKLTVLIPDDLDEALETIARSKGKTKKDVVIEALQGYVGGTIITEETLEKVDARCVWEAIKILNAVADILYRIEERRILMEERLRRKWILAEIARTAKFVKVLKKAKKQIEETEKEEKAEEKSKLDELLEAFGTGLLYALAERTGLVETASVEEAPTGSREIEKQGGKARVEEESSEEEQGEAE